MRCGRLGRGRGFPAHSVVGKQSWFLLSTLLNLRSEVSAIERFMS